MLTEIKQLRTLFKRKMNAEKIGHRFKRAANWELPATIKINKASVPLALLNDRATKTAFINIFLDDCYGLGFINSHQSGIRSIIDIGANQGLFTLAVRNFFAAATIHAYEPNPAVIPFLDSQAKNAGAVYFNEAVGFESGTICLELDKDSLHTRTREDKNGRIKQVAFKDCIDRIGGTADLVKLDCEGAEWRILNDSETLRKVKVITMEYHLNPFENHDKCIKVLEWANFSCMYHSIDGPTWGVVWALNNQYKDS